MALSDRDIRRYMLRNWCPLVITPCDLERDLQPASVDIHLDSVITVPSKGVIDPREKQVPVEIRQMSADRCFTLKPGQFVLGQTIEWVEIPVDLVARIEGKSSIGRLGLSVHITAGFVDPGFSGKLTLELKNDSEGWIVLHPGLSIGQVSFDRLSSFCERPYGSEGLRSKYQGQTKPGLSRLHQEFTDD